jgi:hypothetical protein
MVISPRIEHIARIVEIKRIRIEMKRIRIEMKRIRIEMDWE